MVDKLNIARVSLRIFCAMLLLFAGLGHQPVAARSLPVQGLAVYVLPDGSVSELCLAGEDGKTGKIAWLGCEVCRIAAAILLPEPPRDGQTIERVETPVVFASAPFVRSRLPLEPGASPRGPPAFFA